MRVWERGYVHPGSPLLSESPTQEGEGGEVSTVCASGQLSSG